MKCSSCNADNPHDAEFCEVCGHPLASGRRRTVLGSTPAPAPSGPPDPARKGRTLYDPGPAPPPAPSPTDAFANLAPRPAYDPSDPFRSSIVAPDAPKKAPPTPERRRNKTVLERPAAETRTPTGCLMIGPDRIVPLFAGRTSLGRDPDNDVPIEDPKVSGTHGYLFCKDTGVSFIDTSTNGSLVDDIAVHGEPHPVRHGTVFVLGGTRIAVLLLPPEVASTWLGDAS